MVDMTKYENMSREELLFELRYQISHREYEAKLAKLQHISLCENLGTDLECDVGCELAGLTGIANHLAKTMPNGDTAATRIMRRVERIRERVNTLSTKYRDMWQDK